MVVRRSASALPSPSQAAGFFFFSASSSAGERAGVGRALHEPVLALGEEPLRLVVVRGRWGRGQCRRRR
jgi:hypothetical protein